MVKTGNWMSSNRLTINYTKSFFMTMGRNTLNSSFNVHVNRNKLTQVSSATYLGVKIDDSLSWTIIYMSWKRNFLEHVYLYVN